MQTLGTILINEALPPKYQIRAGETLDKKRLKTLMVTIAREDADLYSRVVLKLKNIGDLLSTTEPFSPGLDDLEPPPGTKALLGKIDLAVKRAPTLEKKIEILTSGQELASEKGMESTGNLGIHVKSGGRGSPGQLMRMIVSPVAASGSPSGVSPVTIKHSYSQGLNAGEYFASAMESRINASASNLSVQRPGAVGKTLNSNLNTLIITEKDCGTSNGLVMEVVDPHVRDRYTADSTKYYTKNTLVDRILLQRLTSSKVGSIKVRSPMTCSSKNGICSYCHGLLENAQLGEVGTNVGVRSAQAMTEPLTQMALDAKHAGRLVSSSGLRGLSGFETLTKVTKNFLNKAIVSRETGVVSSVVEAPQGGYFITVGNSKHYIEPGFKVFIKAGDFVEQGDVLTEGIPSPKDIVENRGLGAGRVHYVNALHNVYKNSGVDLDKRHIENLAKQTLNYVKVNKSQPDMDIYAGEIHNYNRVRDMLKKGAKDAPLADSNGRYLADDYLFHTAGTKINSKVQADLARAGISSVKVTEQDSPISPIMQSIEITPLMNPDLLAKMGFRYLKKSFLDGVTTGQGSDIHGYSPWPGYMLGKEFGKGEKGKY